MIFGDAAKISAHNLCGIFLSMLLLASCTHLAGEDGRVGVCYIPVEIQTFFPVTPEDIDKKCFKLGEVAVSDAKMRKVLRQINTAPLGVFERALVRVKITLPSGKSIYVDGQGGVKFGLSFKAIHPAQLKKVDLLLSEISQNWPDVVRMR